MSSLIDELASRLLSTDFDGWNNSQIPKLMAPVFVLIGGCIGVISQHFTAFSGIPFPVFWLATMAVGYVVLAFVDQHTDALH